MKNKLENCTIQFIKFWVRLIELKCSTKIRKVAELWTQSSSSEGNNKVWLKKLWHHLTETTISCNTENSHQKDQLHSSDRSWVSTFRSTHTLKPKCHSAKSVASKLVGSKFATPKYIIFSIFVYLFLSRSFSKPVKTRKCRGKKGRKDQAVNIATFNRCERDS